MKIECVQDKLERSIEKAAQVASKHETLPVLQCLLFVAGEGILKIRATNLELGVEISIPVKVHEEGVAAIPAETIKRFVSGVSDKNIKIESREENVHIETDHHNTTIKTIAYEDFPTIPDVEKKSSFEIKSKDFIEGLRSVHWASAKSTIKPELSSVYVHQDRNSLFFVATDSFRLAEKKIKGIKTPFDDILISFKSTPEIIRIFDGVRDKIEVSIEENQIAFYHDDVYVTSRIVDGTFPDYKELIPEGKKTEVIVLKDDLIQALRLSNVFSDKFNKLTLKVDSDEGQFSVKSQNKDVGENIQIVDSKISGENIEMSFNYSYVIDAFSSLDSDSITLSFNGIGKPVVVKGVSDPSFTYLVMPMNA